MMVQHRKFESEIEAASGYRPLVQAYHLSMKMFGFSSSGCKGRSVCVCVYWRFLEYHSQHFSFRSESTEEIISV